MAQHHTIGRNYNTENTEKTAHVVYVANEKLGGTMIQNKHFLLLIITEGSTSFRFGTNHITI
jgi:hypothetical protein